MTERVLADDESGPTRISGLVIVSTRKTLVRSVRAANMAWPEN
jgi:hypothetical protein